MNPSVCRACPAQSGFLAIRSQGPAVLHPRRSEYHRWHSAQPLEHQPNQTLGLRSRHQWGHRRSDVDRRTDRLEQSTADGRLRQRLHGEHPRLVNHCGHGRSFIRALRDGGNLLLRTCVTSSRADDGRDSNTSSKQRLVKSQSELKCQWCGKQDSKLRILKHLLIRPHRLGRAISQRSSSSTIANDVSAFWEGKSRRSTLHSNQSDVAKVLSAPLRRAEIK